MKTILFSLLLASAVPAPTVDAAITQTYVKCFADHWEGLESTNVRGSKQIVSMFCEDFWKEKKKTGTPFILTTPDSYQIIPYDVWSKALGNLMTISKEPK